MSKTVSRRSFGKAAGSAAVVGSGLGSAGLSGARIVKSSSARTFPDGFQWGCATAAYQVEGAVQEDGRKPSIWDTFSHTPGKIFQNQTGDVADDSYHRYKEDIQLLKAMGAKVFRFSIAWSRVFPDGVGQPNEKGLAYYQRVTDELLINGIQPYCTLFHWDLPQALQDKFGGWQSRETSKAYAAYAGYVAGKLSDRIKHFFTTNEFVCFTDLSYKTGQFAPGLKLGDAQVNQVRHHAILAHGLGVQAIRAVAKPGTQVGLAENATVYVPVMETPMHIEAAEKATRRLNAQFLTAVMEGKYLDAYLNAEGAAAPKFTPEDMKAIGSPLDFVGLNVYAPEYVRAINTEPGFAVVKKPSSFPHMASPWLYVGPEVIYWAIRNVSNLWKPKTLYITENGCSSDDVVAPDGQIYDTDRLMYLRNHLANLQRAAAEGYPVKGYFLWSLLDNFEWADGYSKRFGVHYVNFKTLKRTPKLSAEFYKEVISNNSVI